MWEQLIAGWEIVIFGIWFIQCSAPSPKKRRRVYENKSMSEKFVDYKIEYYRESWKEWK